MKRWLFGISTGFAVFGVFIAVNWGLSETRWAEARALTHHDMMTVSVTVDSIKPVIHSKTLGVTWRKKWASYVEFYVYGKGLGFPFRTDEYQQFTGDIYDNANIAWREFQSAYETIKPGDVVAVTVKRADMVALENPSWWREVTGGLLDRHRSVFLFSLAKGHTVLYQRDINRFHLGQAAVHANTFNMWLVFLLVVMAGIVGFWLKILK